MVAYGSDLINEKSTGNRQWTIGDGQSTLKAVYWPTTSERRLAKPENQREENVNESILAWAWFTVF